MVSAKLLKRLFDVDRWMHGEVAAITLGRGSRWVRSAYETHGVSSQTTPQYTSKSQLFVPPCDAVPQRFPLSSRVTPPSAEIEVVTEADKATRLSRKLTRRRQKRKDPRGH
jgi:hypothetical protein